MKMLKAWNKQHGGLLSSFHLEAITRASLVNVQISDFPSGVRFVLDKTRSLIQVPLPDPAGYDGDVGRYLNSPQKQREVLARLQRAHLVAGAAERLATAGNIQQAFQRWRYIFGGYFPAYG
jgi:hypothetical protein